MKYFTFSSTDLSTSETTEYVVRVGDDGSYCAFVAADGNPEKAAYDAWLAEGNTPEPWEATNGPV